MIIVNIAGGLGNQMFQYALGRKMSLKNNDVFKLDISAYVPPYSSIRPYRLNNLSIIENIATLEEIRQIKLPHGVISRLMRGIKFRILKIRNIKFKQKILEKKGDIYLSGFWQSEEYFKDIQDIIRQDFTLKNPLNKVAELVKNEIISTPISVSIHVRRGDYIQDPKTNIYHGTCSPVYYESAVKRIYEKTKTPIKLFVFSDDIDWAKNNLDLMHEIVYVSNPMIQEFEELHLMGLCKHHIIANSSFSWWGAWLDPSADKIVIAPRNWTQKEQDNFKNIVPNTWIKI